MPDILVDRFNVTIPEGSKSFKIEKALEPITEQMNSWTLRVNQDTWRQNLSTKEEEVQKLVLRCREITGIPTFRPNARQDCLTYFIQDQKYLPVRRTPTGEPAMDKDVIQVYANQGDGAASKIIEAREAISELSQLRSWEEYARAGEVQTIWNSLGQPMGRMTSEKPCLQNRIKEIRETIEARPGYQLISWDLGSAEYVTWASLSKDPLLMDIFLKGKDVHTEMIQLLMAMVPELDIGTEEPRQFGKMINHAICYRMQEWTLAAKLGCDVKTAFKIMEAYRDRGRVACAYQEQVLADARSTGEVSTYFGRIRSIPILRKARGGELHEAEKTAWHHVNCGTTAEIVKIKTLRAVSALKQEGIYPSQAKLVLQMHDEIVLEVEEGSTNRVAEIGDEAFQKPIEGFLPYKIDRRIGKDWLSISK